MSRKFSRREVLLSGIGAAGLAVAQGVAPLAAADLRWLPPGVADRSALAPAAPVAIQKCPSYEPQLLRDRLDTALNLIGGIKKLVAGKTVTIKINVTGGPAPMAGMPGFRTYQVHPNMLAALCASLRDAGARRIVVVESQYSTLSPEEVLAGGGWDVAQIKSAGGQQVIFEDTRNRGRWPRYARLRVPWGGYLFPAFDVNSRYANTDVFVSLAKLKDHLSAGVTLSVKNLFGILPASLYANDAPNEGTTSNREQILHDGVRPVPAGVPAAIAQQAPAHWKQRVPRVTADVLGARPVDLAIVDGIETSRGGEGPWSATAQPLKPGLLLVGRNPVCTDAVGTAVMGYDPQAGHGQFPFPGENHLLLLAAVGVGAIDIKRIEVAGVPLQQALFPFNPQKRKLADPTAMFHGRARSLPAGFEGMC
ncbi:MAG: DUF362 domain-containing protein [Thermoguttaceae bacterium]|jgi:uncharacterized protein (DUF362 family)